MITNNHFHKNTFHKKIYNGKKITQHRPSTPFGKFFNSIGIWRPKLEDAVKDLFDHLHDTEQKAVTKASGLIAITNANLDKLPDVAFELIQTQFPDVSKEQPTDILNQVNREIVKVDQSVPADFDTALTTLQNYLKKYEGRTWGVISKSVVVILSDIFLGGKSSIQKTDSVLEYVLILDILTNTNIS